MTFNHTPPYRRRLSISCGAAGPGFVPVPTQARAAARLSASAEPAGSPAPNSGIELLAWKDHVLGGFRLYRKGDLFAALVMDDPESLSDNPAWDLANWLESLPDPATLDFFPHDRVYAHHFRNSNDSHASWNVCAMLMDIEIAKPVVAA